MASHRGPVASEHVLRRQGEGDECRLPRPRPRRVGRGGSEDGETTGLKCREEGSLMDFFGGEGVSIRPSVSFPRDQHKGLNCPRDSDERVISPAKS